MENNTNTKDNGYKGLIFTNQTNIPSKSYFDYYVEGKSTLEIMKDAEERNVRVVPPESIDIEAEKFGLNPDDPEVIQAYNNSLLSYEKYKVGEWNMTKYNIPGPRNIYNADPRFPNYDPNEQFNYPLFPIQGYNKDEYENKYFHAPTIADEKGYILNPDGTKEDFSGPFKGLIWGITNWNYKLVLGNDKYGSPVWIKQHISYPSYSHEERSLFGHDIPRLGLNGFVGDILNPIINFLEPIGTGIMNRPSFYYTIKNWGNNLTAAFNDTFAGFDEAETFRKLSLEWANNEFQKLYPGLKKDDNAEGQYKWELLYKQKLADFYKLSWEIGKAIPYDYGSVGLAQAYRSRERRMSMPMVTDPSTVEKYAREAGHIAGIIFGSKVGSGALVNMGASAKGAHTIINTYFGTHAMMASTSAYKEMGLSPKNSFALGLFTGATTLGVFQWGGNALRGLSSNAVVSDVFSKKLANVLKSVESTTGHSISNMTKTESRNMVNRLGNYIGRAWNNPKTFGEAFVFGGAQEGIKFSSLSFFDNIMTTMHDEWWKADDAKPGQGMIGEISGEGIWETYKDRFNDNMLEGFISGFIAGGVTIAGQIAGRIIKPTNNQKRFSKGNFRFPSQDFEVADLVLRREDSRIFKNIDKMEARKEFHIDDNINKNMADAAREEVRMAIAARDARMLSNNPESKTMAVVGNAEFMKEVLVRGIQIERNNKSIKEGNLPKEKIIELEKQNEILEREIDEYIKPEVITFSDGSVKQLKHSKKYNDSLLMIAIADGNIYDPISKSYKDIVEKSIDKDGNVNYDFSMAEKMIKSHEYIVKLKSEYVKTKIENLKSRKESSRLLKNAEDILQNIENTFKKFNTKKNKNVGKFRELHAQLKDMLNTLKETNERAYKEGMTTSEADAWEAIQDNYEAMLSTFSPMFQEVVDKASAKFEKYRSKTNLPKNIDTINHINKSLKDPNLKAEERKALQHQKELLQKENSEIMNSDQYKTLSQERENAMQIDIDIIGPRIEGIDPFMSDDIAMRRYERKEAEKYERDIEKLNDPSSPEYSQVIDGIRQEFYDEKLNEFGKTYNIDTKAFVYNLDTGKFQPDYEYMANVLERDGVNFDINNNTDVYNKFHERYNNLVSVEESHINNMINDFNGELNNNGSIKKLGIIDFKSHIDIEDYVVPKISERLGENISKDEYGVSKGNKLRFYEDFALLNSHYRHFLTEFNEAEGKTNEFVIIKTKHDLIKRGRVANFVLNVLLEDRGSDPKKGGILDIIRKQFKNDAEVDDIIKKLTDYNNFFDNLKNKTADQLIKDENSINSILSNIRGFEELFYNISSRLNTDAKKQFFSIIGESFPDPSNKSYLNTNLNANSTWEADLFMPRPGGYPDSPSVNDFIASETSIIGKKSLGDYVKKFTINYLATISRFNTQEFYRVLKDIRDASIDNKDKIFFTNEQSLTIMQAVSKYLAPDMDAVTWMDLAMPNKSEDNKSSEYYRRIRRAININGHAGVGKSTSINHFFDVIKRISLLRAKGVHTDVSPVSVLFVGSNEAISEKAMNDALGRNNNKLNDNSDFIITQGNRESKAISYDEYIGNIEKYKNYDIVVIDESHSLSSVQYEKIRQNNDVTYDNSGKIISSKAQQEAKSPFFLCLGDPAQKAAEKGATLVSTAIIMENTDSMIVNKRFGVNDIVYAEKILRDAIGNVRSDVKLDTSWEAKPNEQGNKEFKGIRIFSPTLSGQRELRSHFSEVYNEAVKTGKKISYIIEKSENIETVRETLGIKEGDDVVSFRAIDIKDNTHKQYQILGIETDYTFVDYLPPSDKNIAYYRDILTSLTRAKKYVSMIFDGTSNERPVIDTSTAEYMNSEKGKLIQKLEIENRKKQKDITDRMVSENEIIYPDTKKEVKKETDIQEPVSSEQSPISKGQESIKPPASKPLQVENLGGTGEQSGPTKAAQSGSSSKELNVEHVPGNVIRGRGIKQITIPQDLVEVTADMTLTSGHKINAGEVVSIEVIRESNVDGKKKYFVTFSNDLYNEVEMTPKELNDFFNNNLKRYQQHVDTDASINSNHVQQVITKKEKDAIRTGRRGWSYVRNKILSGIVKVEEGVDKTSFMKKLHNYFSNGEGVSAKRPVEYTARREAGRVYIELWATIDGERTKLGNIFEHDNIIKSGKGERAVPIEPKKENIEIFKKAVQEAADIKYGVEPANDILRDYKEAFIKMNSDIFLLEVIANDKIISEGQSIPLDIKDNFVSMTGGYVRYETGKENNLREFLNKNNLEIETTTDTGEPIINQSSVSGAFITGKIRTFIKVRNKSENGSFFEIDISTPRLSLQGSAKSGEIRDTAKRYFDDIKSKGEYFGSELDHLLNFNRGSVFSLIDAIEAPNFLGGKQNAIEALKRVKGLLDKSPNKRFVVIKKGKKLTEDNIAQLLEDFRLIETVSRENNNDISFFTPFGKSSFGKVSLDINTATTNAVEVLMPELKLDANKIEEFIRNNNSNIVINKETLKDKELSKEDTDTIEDSWGGENIDNDSAFKGSAKTLTEKQHGTIDKYQTEEEAMQEVRRELGDEWLRDKVFKTDRKYVKGNNDKVWGFVNDGVVIYSLAENGKLPVGLFSHELTHIELNYFIPQAEKDAIIKAGRELIKLKDENIDPDNMLDYEVEEWIAEKRRLGEISEITDLYDSLNDRYILPNKFRLDFLNRRNKLFKAAPAIRYLYKSFNYQIPKEILKESSGMINDNTYALAESNRHVNQIISTVVNELLEGDNNLYTIAKNIIKLNTFRDSNINRDPLGKQLDLFESLRLGRLGIIKYADEIGNRKVKINGEEKPINQLTKIDLDNLNYNYKSDRKIGQMFIGYKLAQQTSLGELGFDLIAKATFQGINIKNVLPSSDIDFVLMQKELKNYEDALRRHETGEQVLGTENYERTIEERDRIQNELNEFIETKGDPYERATEEQLDIHNNSYNFDDSFKELKGNKFTEILLSLTPRGELSDEGEILTIKDKGIQEKAVSEMPVDITMMKSRLIKIAQQSIVKASRYSIEEANKWDIFIKNIREYLDKERDLYINTQTMNAKSFSRSYQMLKSFLYEYVDSPYSYENQTKDPLRFIEKMLKERDDVPLTPEGGERYNLEDISYALKRRDGRYQEGEIPELEARYSEKFADYVIKEYKRIINLDIVMNSIRSEFTSIVPLSGTGVKKTKIFIPASETSDGGYNEIIRKYNAVTRGVDAFKDKIKRQLDENISLGQLDDVEIENTESREVIADKYNVRDKNGKLKDKQESARIATMNPDKLNMFDSTDKFSIKINLSKGEDGNYNGGTITNGNEVTPILRWSIDRFGKLIADFDSNNLYPLQSIMKLMKKIGMPYQNARILQSLYNGSNINQSMTSQLMAMADARNIAVPNRQMLAELLTLSTLSLKVTHGLTLSDSKDVKLQGDYTIESLSELGTPIFVETAGKKNEANYFMDSLIASGYLPDATPWGSSVDATGEPTARMNYVPSDFWKHIESFSLFEDMSTANVMHQYYYNPKGKRIMNHMQNSALTNRFAKSSEQDAHLLSYKMAEIRNRLKEGKPYHSGAILSLPVFRVLTKERKNKDNITEYMKITELEHFMGMSMGDRGEDVAGLNSLDFINSMLNGNIFDPVFKKGGIFQNINIFGLPGGNSTKTPIYKIESLKDDGYFKIKRSGGKITEISTERSTADRMSRIDYEIDCNFQYYSKLWAESVYRLGTFLESEALGLKGELKNRIVTTLNKNGLSKMVKMMDKIRVGEDLISKGTDNEIKLVRGLQKTINNMLIEVQSTLKGTPGAFEGFKKAVLESELYSNIDYIDTGDYILLGRTAEFKFDKVYNFENYADWSSVRDNKQDILTDFRNNIFAENLNNLVDYLKQKGYKLPMPLQSPELFPYNEDTGKDIENMRTGLRRKPKKTYFEWKTREDMIDKLSDKYIEEFVDIQIMNKRVYEGKNKEMIYLDSDGKEMGLDQYKKNLKEDIKNLRKEIEKLYIKDREGKEFTSLTSEEVEAFYNEILNKYIEEFSNDFKHFGYDSAKEAYDNLIKANTASVMLEYDGGVSIDIESENKKSKISAWKTFDNFEIVNEKFSSFDKQRSSTEGMEFHPFIEGSYFAHHNVNTSVTAILRGDINGYKQGVDFYKQYQNAYRQGMSFSLGNFTGLPEKSNVMIIKDTELNDENFNNLFGARDDIADKRRQPINSRLGIIDNYKDLMQYFADGNGIIDPISDLMYKNSIGGETFGRLGEGMRKFIATSKDWDKGTSLDLKYGLQTINEDFYRGRIADNMLKVMFGPTVYSLYKGKLAEGKSFNDTIKELTELIYLDNYEYQNEVKANPNTDRVRLYDTMVHQIVSNKLAKGNKSKIQQTDLFGYDISEQADMRYSNFFNEVSSFDPSNDIQMRSYRDYLDSKITKINNKDIFMQLNPEQDVTQKAIALAKQWPSQISVGINNQERSMQLDNLLLQFARNTFNEFRRDMGIKSDGTMTAKDLMDYLKRLGDTSALNMKDFGMLLTFLNDPNMTAEMPGFGDMLLPMFYNKFNDGIKLRVPGVRATQAPDMMIERVFEPETGQWVDIRTFERLHPGKKPFQFKNGLESSKYQYIDIDGSLKDFVDTETDVNGVKTKIYAHEHLEKAIRENKVNVKPEEVYIAFPHIKEFFDGDKSVQLHDVTIVKTKSGLRDLQDIAEQDMESFVRDNIAEIQSGLHPTIEKKLNRYMSKNIKSILTEKEIKQFAEAQKMGEAGEAFIDTNAPEIKNKLSEAMVDYLTNYYNSFNKVLDMIIIRVPLETSAFVTKGRIVGFTNNSTNTIFTSPYRVVRDGTDYDIDQVSTYFKNVTVGKDGKIVVQEVKGYDNTSISNETDNKAIMNGIIDRMFDYHNDVNNIIRNNVILSTNKWKIARDKAMANNKIKDKYNQPNDLGSALYMREVNTSSQELIGIFANSVDALARLQKLPAKMWPKFLSNLHDNLDTKYSITVGEGKEKERVQIKVTTDMLTNFDNTLQEVRTLIDLAVDDVKLSILGPAGVNKYVANIVVAAAIDKTNFPNAEAIIKYIQSDGVRNVINRLEWNDTLGNRSKSIFDVIRDIVEQKEAKFIESKSKTYDMYRRIFADEKETLGIGTDRKKKRIIQWLTANKYILPNHLLGKKVKIDETGEYAFIDDPKLGKGKISFNPNDYITTKNDDLGIKGLEALRLDTDFPEVRWHKKSIKDLIGDNTIETMMDKPEGLVKLALQGEWLRGLSNVLNLSGGSEVKDWDIYRQLKTFESSTGISFNDFVNKNFISRTEGGKTVLDDALFEKHIERMGISTPTKDYALMIKKERALKNIGDIGEIIYNMPHIKEYITQFNNINNIVKNSLFMHSFAIENIMEQINVNNRIGPIVWKNQYYNIKNALGQNIISSYFATLDPSKRIIEMPMFFEGNQVSIDSIKNIDLKDSWGQQLFFKQFANMIKNYKNIYETLGDNKIDNEFVRRLTVNGDWIDFEGITTLTPQDFQIFREEYKSFLNDVKKMSLESKNPIQDMDKKMDRMFQIYQLLKSGFSSKQSDFTPIINIEEFSKVGNFITELHNYVRAVENYGSVSEANRIFNSNTYESVYKELKRFAENDLPVLVDGVAKSRNKAEELNSPTEDMAMGENIVTKLRDRRPRYATVFEKVQDKFFRKKIAELGEIESQGVSEKGYGQEIPHPNGSTWIKFHTRISSINKTTNGGVHNATFLKGDGVIKENKQTIVIKEIPLELYNTISNILGPIDKAADMIAMGKNADLPSTKTLIPFSLDYIGLKSLKKDILAGSTKNIIINGRMFEIVKKDLGNNLLLLEAKTIGSFNDLEWNNIIRETKVIKQDGVPSDAFKVDKMEKRIINTGLVDNIKKWKKENNYDIEKALEESTKFQVETFDKDGTRKITIDDVEVITDRSTKYDIWPGATSDDPYYMNRGQTLNLMYDNWIAEANAIRKGITPPMGIRYDIPISSGTTKYKISDYFSKQEYETIKNNLMFAIAELGPDAKVFTRVNVFGQVVEGSDKGSKKVNLMSGEIDMVYIKNNKVTLVDFKAGDIQKGSKNYEYYVRQLNRYKALFESLYGLKVEGLELWHLRAEDMKGNKLSWRNYKDKMEKNYKLNKIIFDKSEIKEGYGVDIKTKGKFSFKDKLQTFKKAIEC